MNIQGLEFLSNVASLEDASDADLRMVCQVVLELKSDCDRLWVAMPQSPQMHGDMPQDSLYFGEPSSS